MSRRVRRGVLALGVVLTLVASGALIGRVVSPPPAAPVAANEDWSARVHACVPGSAALAEGAHQEVAQECLADVVVAAAQARQVVPLLKALRAEIDKDLRFYSACHNFLHRGGQRAYALYPSMVEMIDENRYDVCGYAFVHGGFDALAHDKPDLVDFARIADKCLEIRTDPGMERAEGLCAHGLGHAAWLTSRSLEQSARFCAVIDNPEMKQVCGDGVIMEIYEPVTGEPARDIANATEELVTMCQQWPEPEKTGYGCYSGAGYVYMRAAHDYVDQEMAVQAFSGTDQGQNTLTVENVNRLRELVTQAVALCKAHDSAKGVSACLSMTAQEVPPPAYWSAELIDAVCGQMNEWAEQCRKTPVYF